MNIEKAVFTVDSQSVYHGALAGVSFSYHEARQYKRQVILKVLEGKKPEEIPIKSPSDQEIFLNLVSVKKLGIRIPS